MNKKHLKRIRKFVSKLTLFTLLFSLFLSGISVDEVWKYVKDKNVVDVMWQSENSKKVVDLFQPERVQAAFSSPTARGSAVNSANHTSLSVSPSANLTVGKLVIVTAVSNNKQTTDGDSTEHTITDTHEHTWNKVFERTETDGAQNDGSTSSLWWTIVTTQIGTGDSITNTYTNGTNNAGIIAITEATFDYANNNIVADGNTPTHSASGSSISHSRSSLTSRQYLWFGFHGAEGNDNSKTPIANYTERFDLRSGTTASTDVQMHVGTRIATLTGDTWTSSATTYTSGIQSLTAFYESPKPTNTLSDSTDPGNSTIAPGASVTDIDQFAFTTSSGSDTVTAVTVTLSPASSYDNLSKVEITNTSNTDVCTDIDNPSSVTLNFSGCSISATTGGDTYKIRITPKTHANMPAVPGASYGTTATVTGWTGGSGYAKTGTDTDSATITVDNASPNNATSVTATAGDTVVDLAWTNSNSADFDEIIVLRHTSAISDAPVEGTEYSNGNTIGSATVVCNTSSTSCQDTSLSNGTAYHYKIFSQDTNGNYDAGVVPTGSPATPVAPVVISGTTDMGDESNVIKVAINGSIDSASGSISNGTWSINPVTPPTTGQTVVVFVNGHGDSTESTAVGKYGGSGDMTDMVLNTNVLSIGSVDDQSMTIANIDGAGDCNLDEDIMFESSATALSVQGCSNSYTDEIIQIESGDTLVIDSDETLTTDNLVITGTLTQTTTGVITATGNITSSGTFNGGSGAISVIDLTISSGTFTSTSGTLTISGNYSNSGTFTDSSGTVTFDSTSTGKTLSGTLNGSSDFYNVIFNGSGGGWSNSSAMLVTNDLTVTAGTLSGTNNITVNGGDVTGNGTINLTGGTFLLDGTGNFGGDTAWTFSSLTFGDGSGATATTATGSGGITTTSVLTIAANQTLNAGSKTYTLSGSGTPFVMTGTFTADTSTFQYTGTSATNIANGTYYNLSLIPAGTVTYTLGTSSSTITTNGALLVGDGVNAVTASTSTYGPHMNISGGATISTNATLSGTGAGTFFILSGSSLTVNGTMDISPNGFLRMDGNGGSLAGTGPISTGKIRFGDTVGTESTTSTGSGTVTVTDEFQISSGHTFNAGTRTYILSKSGAAFPRTGSFTGTLNAQTSTFQYTGTSASNISALTYYNLDVKPGANGITHTADAGTLNVTNNLTVGNGTNTGTFNLNTNDPTVDVGNDVTIAASGTLVASASGTFTIGGSYSNSGTFTDSSGTVTFDSTSTGETLSGTLNGSSDFYNLEFTGSGGGWSNSSAMLVTGYLYISAGTLSGTNNITVNGGTFSGGASGVVNLTGGTVLLDGDGDFGGDSAWSFNNLTFGDGSVSQSTIQNGTGAVTVSGVLTVATNQTLNAGSKTWTLSGSGTPFVRSGTFNSDTSTFQYTGTSATNITATTYNNLNIGTTANATDVTYTLLGDTIVSGALNIGASSNTGVHTLDQGATHSLTSGALTVNSLGKWNNIGTGSVTLSGDVSNAGVIILNSNNGSSCVDDTDSILIRSSINNTLRNWSGAGVYTLRNLDVDDMTGSISAEVSNFSADTTWTDGCGTPAFDIIHYRWRNDNGSESGASNLKGEDTSISSSDRVNIGDRLRLRILASNTGTGPGVGTNFQLEYASSSCSQWVAVPTSVTVQNEHWKMSLSQYALDSSATTDSAGLTNPGGKTFTAGYFMHTNNQTPLQSIDDTQFTEHEFSIRSNSNAEAGLTYCFRLTDAGSVTNFSYSVQPQAVLSLTLGPQNGGVNFETSGGGVLRSGGGPQGGDGSEGGGSGPAQGGGGSGGGGGDVGGAFTSWFADVASLLASIEEALKEISKIVSSR